MATTYISFFCSDPVQFPDVGDIVQERDIPLDSCGPHKRNNHRDRHLAPRQDAVRGPTRRRQDQRQQNSRAARHNSNLHHSCELLSDTRGPSCIRPRR